jgi:hypothetical protein
MKLDFLFGQSQSNKNGRREPRLKTPAGGGAARDRPSEPSAPSTVPALPPPEIRVAVRRMSPRQLAAWAHEMYLCGALSWDEYAMAGFPAELHPQYNRTIGALTGQRAQPDAPRDMVKEWEDRLAFALRHNTALEPYVRRTEKVLNLLRQCGLATEKSRFHF